MRRSIILGIVIVGLAGLASARQRPGGAPVAARPMPAAPPASGRVAPLHAPSSSHPISHPVAPGMRSGTGTHTVNHSGNSQSHHSWNNAANTIRNNYCAGQPLNNYNGNPIPGFGFDYEHFYAVHPNWNTCHQGSNAVVSWLGGGYGGYGMPYPYYSANGSQEDEQQGDSNDRQDSGRQISAQEASSPSSSSRQSSYTYSPAEPVAEFVFVKRDGSTFNAVAYTLLKDKIRYVTKDGLRRTVPLDSLDLEATQKTNEERGTTIEFPGLSHA